MGRGKRRTAGSLGVAGSAASRTTAAPATFPALDAAIAEYRPRALRDGLDRPEGAEGLCWAATHSFLGVLATHQHHAVRLVEDHPEELGLEPTRQSRYRHHTVCVVRGPDDTRYLVDWTAAQYGHDEFPLVRAMTAEEWLDYAGRRLTRYPHPDF